MEAVAEAHDAGFDHVNLDLIYGTPGETIADWEASVRAAVDAGPDHVSAYALIVEPGTNLAARIRRGELPMPDDDDLADKYLLADDLLTGAGFRWYEVSNWAASERGALSPQRPLLDQRGLVGRGTGRTQPCRRRPVVERQASRGLGSPPGGGREPAQAREVLDVGTRRVERVLLETRLVDGLDVAVLDDAGRAATDALTADGLLEPGGLEAGRLVLTRRGRLLADLVVRDLVA